MDVDGADIFARGITVFGPQGVVFDHVDLRVDSGDLAVVVGAGGTGRTSMLLALSGRIHVATGHLEVSGYLLPTEARSVRKLIVPARLRPGFELEPRHLVREAIRERRMISRVSAAEIEEACDLLGVDADPSTLVSELHPADRLLLSIALAAAEKPAGIVVDDVEAGLPLSSRTRVWAALRALTGSGMTVLASAADPPFGGDAALIRLPYGRPDFDEPNDHFPLFDRTRPLTEDHR